MSPNPMHAPLLSDAFIAKVIELGKRRAELIARLKVALRSDDTDEAIRLAKELWLDRGQEVVQ